jgi:hypothetical protein
MRNLPDPQCAAPWLSSCRREASLVLQGTVIERPDPDALLAGPLGEWLAAQQGLREEARAKVAHRRRLAIGGAAAVGIIMLMLTRDIEIALAFGFVAGAGGFIWAQAAATPVMRAIKDGINQAVAKALDLDFTIDVATGEEWRRAKSFGMLPSYDREAFEDCWSGRLGALPFRSYEAHCREWQGSGKSRRLVTVFRGAVLSVAFTRRFQGTTLVEGDGRRTKWFGGEKEEVELDGIVMQRCDMVDPAFEDRFTVWGSDPVEARYLVHPEYIERLTAVERAFAGKHLRALFCGGDLLILVETGDQFESGSLDAGQDHVLLARTIEQFGTLADLAQRLNEAPRGNFVPAA